MKIKSKFCANLNIVVFHYLSYLNLLVDISRYGHVLRNLGCPGRPYCFCVGAGYRGARFGGVTDEDEGPL